MQAEIDANEAAIAALEAEHADAISALQAEIDANEAAIAALEAEHADAVALIKAAMDKNSADILALKTSYEANVLIVEQKIAALEADIKKAADTLEARISAIEEKHDEDVAAINALITELQGTETDNTKRIAALEEQMRALLSVTYHKVTFLVGGGSDAFFEQSVAHGEKAVKPADPTLENKVFLGWYVEDEKWSFVGYTVTEDITLSARWVDTGIISTYGNATLAGNKLSILVKRSDRVGIYEYIEVDRACDVSLYGEYAYGDCYINCNTVGRSTSYLSISYDGVVQNTYTVDLLVVDYATAYVNGVYTQLEISHDLMVYYYDTPYGGDGYRFVSWSLNGEEIEFPVEYHYGDVYYANFEAIPYTVTYHYNDGVADVTATDTYTVESGLSLITPYREFYDIVGWYDNPELTGEPIESIEPGTTGDIHLYTDWRDITNGVKFSLNSDGESYAITGYVGESTDVVIPGELHGKKVTILKGNAFRENASITSVVIPDSVSVIEAYAFLRCPNLITVTLPASITAIADNMFNECSSLQRIVIPDEVLTIGNQAFRQCTSLEYLYIPDSVTEIGKNVFNNCLSLTSVDLPAGLKSIGQDAFNSCKGLTTVTIPDGLVSIGKTAFSNCNKLETIFIPSSVTSIGEKAFNACSVLTILTAHSGVPNTWDANWNNSNRLVEFNYVSSGTYEGFEYHQTFGGVIIMGYTGTATELEIPGTINGAPVTKIYQDTFKGHSDMVSVTIPDSVIEVGAYAFSGCTSLTEVVIGSGVTSFGYSVFGGCAALERVYISSVESWCAVKFMDAQSNPLYYAGSLYLTDGTRVENLVIPDGVVSIGAHAFAYSDITSVTVPTTLRSVGSSAFASCKSLTAVYISDLYSWCLIDFVADVSSPLWYAKNLYLNGEQIFDLEIPAGITEIKPYAFGHANIKSAIIPEGVTSIGKKAFSECRSLYAVSMPQSVQAIGANAFYDCRNITEVILPDGVIVGSDAFYGCRSLSSLTVGENVSLGYRSFGGESSLRTVVLPESMLRIYENTFGYYYASDEYYYPQSYKTEVYFEGSIDEWNEILVWYEYEDMSYICYVYSAEAPEAEGKYWHYGDNGEILVW